MENLNGFAYLMRYKQTQPFSQRLNDWIIERTKAITFIAGSFAEMEFEDWKEASRLADAMLISNENCEGTIFGDKHINVLFRAWHDSLHLEMNEGFGYMSEARVAFKQCAELPIDWGFERELIMCEVIAQAAYHEKYGTFVENQRAFTINVLNGGQI